MAGWSSIKRSMEAWNDAQAAKAPGAIAEAIVQQVENEKEQLRGELAEALSEIRKLQAKAGVEVMPETTSEKKRRGRKPKSTETPAEG